MTQPTPIKKASLVDFMSPDDAAKAMARQHRAYEKKSRGVNPEWMMLGELGFYFGWEAIRAFNNNEMTIDQANMYIQSARKVHSGHVYDSAVANIAAQSGNFDKIMKTYIDDMEVEQ